MTSVNHAHSSTTLTDRHVQALAHRQAHRPVARSSGAAYSGAELRQMVLGAAAQQTAIEGYCRQLPTGPHPNTVRTALITTLPPEQVETAVNAALAAELVPQPWRQPQTLAIDLHLVPYHGQPHRQADEVRRGAAKRGTTHFHAFATVYVRRQHRRYPLAFTWVRAREPVLAVLQRLLARVQALGLAIAPLLLDRECCQGAVLPWLVAQGYAFIVPVVRRGRRQPPTATQRLAALHTSQWTTYPWYSPTWGAVTVPVAVVGRHQGGRRGRETLLYAVGGFARCPRLAWVVATYRARFGIESSYRQAGPARFRTTSRQPVLRVLALGVAWLLRNVWLTLRWTLGRRQRGRHGRWLPKGFFAFRQFLHWLEGIAWPRFGHVHALLSLGDGVELISG